MEAGCHRALHHPSTQTLTEARLGFSKRSHLVDAEVGNDITETFGERIRRVRQERKLGLRQAASKAGISAIFLFRVETEKKPAIPSEDTIRKLAAVLGDDFDELMQLPAIKVPHLAPAQLDSAARELLARYARWKGEALAPPIDMDEIVEGLLGDVDALIVCGDGSALPTGANRHGKRTCDCKRDANCECPRRYSGPQCKGHLSK